MFVRMARVYLDLDEENIGALDDTIVIGAQYIRRSVSDNSTHLKETNTMDTLRIHFCIYRLSGKHSAHSPYVFPYHGPAVRS